MPADGERPAKRRRLNHEQMQHRLDLPRFIARYAITPDAPIIFGSYMRVVFHIVGIAFVLFVLFRVLQSFTAEIQARYYSELDEIKQTAQLCHQKYVDHNCSPHLKGVVWKKYCDEWNRQFQPKTVAKTKIAARVFGEMINGFVQPLSLKAMLIICSMLFGFFIASCLIQV